MAREKMVTRTVVFTNAKFLAVDTVNRTMAEKNCRLLGSFDDDKTLLSYLSKRYNTETEKVISVLNRNTDSVLMGMDERRFIINAKQLDNRFENGRTRMVTRTVNITKGNALFVDIENRSVREGSYSVNGVYDNHDTLLKAVQSNMAVDNAMVVSILTAETKSVLCGMTEQMFCAMADILPPRKVYGDSVEGGDEE